MASLMDRHAVLSVVGSSRVVVRCWYPLLRTAAEKAVVVVAAVDLDLCRVAQYACVEVVPAVGAHVHGRSGSGETNLKFCFWFL